MRPDENVVTNTYATEYSCEGAELYAVTNRWMPLALGVAGNSTCTQRDTTKHVTVVTNTGCLAKYSTNAMIEYKPLTDVAERVKLCARQQFSSTGDK